MIKEYSALWQGLYYLIGVCAIPIFAYWSAIANGDEMLPMREFLISLIPLFSLTIVVSFLVYRFVSHLFLKMVLITAYTLIISVFYFIFFSHNLFILGMLGVGVMSVAILFFEHIKKIFKDISNSHIINLAALASTLFAAFASSLMVGFIISYSDFYLPAVDNPQFKQVINAGMGGNLFITVYYWVGCGFMVLQAVGNVYKLRL